MTPDFDELIGTEGSSEELEELRRVHELLLAADPPPLLEVPLRRKPRPRFGFAWSRRPVLVLGFAAVFSAALGLATGLAVDSGSGFGTGISRPMHGVGAAHAASALIKVGKEDVNGNRQLQFNVQSLPALPDGGSYELYLTKKGKLEVPCGVFRTGANGAAHVRMNAPGDLEEYDGWVVTALTPGHSSGVLLST